MGMSPAQGENGRGYGLCSLPRRVWVECRDRGGKSLANGIGFGLSFPGHISRFLDFL